MQIIYCNCAFKIEFKKKLQFKQAMYLEIQNVVSKPYHSNVLIFFIPNFKTIISFIYSYFRSPSWTLKSSFLGFSWTKFFRPSSLTIRENHWSREGTIAWHKSGKLQSLYRWAENQKYLMRSLLRKSQSLNRSKPDLNKPHLIVCLWKPNTMFLPSVKHGGGGMMIWDCCEDLSILINSPVQFVSVSSVIKAWTLLLPRLLMRRF